MSVPLKPLREQVVVITGASSGIGLATARAAAAAGAGVVLVARNDSALATEAEAIRAAGGAALHVAADVGLRADLQHVAERAIERFGGFDTWVNNAGVGIFGRLAACADDDARQLFQTNFWGLVHGSLIAAEHFRRRGGAIINMGSVAGDVGVPLQGFYAASKAAIGSFTDTLRLELASEGAPISVTLVKPASINTPFPQHARNVTGRGQQLPPPVYAPEEVAHAVLHAAEHGGRDIYVGGAGRILTGICKIAPQALDLVSTGLMDQQFRDGPARRPEGTLYRPGEGGAVLGDQPGHTMRTSLYTRATTHPIASVALLGGAMFAGIGLSAALMNGKARRRR